MPHDFLTIRMTTLPEGQGLQLHLYRDEPGPFQHWDIIAESTGKTIAAGLCPINPELTTVAISAYVAGLEARASGLCPMDPEQSTVAIDAYAAGLEARAPT